MILSASSPNKKYGAGHNILTLDKIFSLVLLLNLTGIFSFMSLLFGVDIATVSLILFALNCLYIAANHNVTRQLFRKKHVFYWFIFLGLWPFLAALYSPVFNIRELGLQLYYFTLLLTVIIYMQRKGFDSFHRIVTLAVVITISGLILSIFAKDVFQSVASATGHDIQFEGRAYGFFMQPNLAAINSILLFVVWFGGLRTTRYLAIFLSSFGLLVLVSLTGSRGGYIEAMAVLFLIFLYQSIRVKKPFRVLSSPKYTITFLAVLGCFLVSVPLLLNFLSERQPKLPGGFDVAARIKAISQMNLTEKDSKGRSTVTNRMQVFSDYYALICKHPLSGHGFGSNTVYINEGTLHKSSHNQYLKITFEAGIFYLIFYIGLLFLMYRDPKRKQIERLLYTNSYAQLLAVIILAGAVSNVVLDSRVLYCVLGCFIAMLIFPQTITDDSIQKRYTPSPAYREPEC